jgi:hypothetical protein
MEKYLKMINTGPLNLRIRYYKINHYTHDTIRNIHATNEAWTEVWIGVQYQVSQMKILSVKDSTQRWIFGND